MSSVSTWKAPEIGDLVWCNFPEDARLQPGPKPRPAIVVAVDERLDGCMVQVIPGTSQRVDQLYAGEFAILKSNLAAFKLAGLTSETKFQFGSMLNLPWTSNFFKVPPLSRHGETPVLGTLHASVMRSFFAAYEAIKDRL